MGPLRVVSLAAALAGITIATPLRPAGAADAATTDVLVGFVDSSALEDALSDTLAPADPAATRVDAETATADLTADELAALAADPRVTVIEPDAEVHTAEAPNDPCFLATCAGTSAYHLNQVELPAAWNLSHGAGVLIAVIDSGVDEMSIAVNPDLSGKITGDVAPATVTGPECHPGQPDADHGTAVSSVAAARPNNGVGTAGTGWDAQVLSVRVFEDRDGGCRASVEDIISAIDAAIAHGADVINISLTTASNSTLLRNAVGRALAAGIPVVGAAGNSSSSDPGFGSGGYPASWPEVIAVGSLTQAGQRAPTSNFGDWVDVYAPGTALPAYGRNGQLGSFSGTSFAAPVVAGIVGLMRASYPPAPPDAIQAHIRNTAPAIPAIAGGRAVRAFGAVLAMPTADLLLRDSASAGAPQRVYSFGLNSYQHLHCDFDGDGIDGIVVFASGTWVHRPSSSAGSGVSFAFGATGYAAVCGDWDGVGGDGIGVFVNGSWYLRNSPSPGPPQVAFAYGTTGYVPVVGDWDGIGGDGIGVFVDGTWYLRNTPTPGSGLPIAYGTRGYLPVVGDWDGGGGPQGIGVFVGGSWYLRDTASAGPPQRAFAYGSPGTVPITGATLTPGLDGIGIVHP